MALFYTHVCHSHSMEDLCTGIVIAAEGSFTYLMKRVAFKVYILDHLFFCFFISTTIPSHRINSYVFCSSLLYMFV